MIERGGQRWERGRTRERGKGGDEQRNPSWVFELERLGLRPSPRQEQRRAREEEE